MPTRQPSSRPSASEPRQPATLATPPPLPPRTREEIEAAFPVLDRAPFEALLEEKLNPVLAELDILEAAAMDEDTIDLYKVAKSKGEAGKVKCETKRSQLEAGLSAFIAALTRLTSALDPIKSYFEQLSFTLLGSESRSLSLTAGREFGNLIWGLESYTLGRLSFVKGRQAFLMGNLEEEPHHFDTATQSAELKVAAMRTLDKVYLTVKDAVLEKADAEFRAYEEDRSAREAAAAEAARAAAEARQAEADRVAAEAARTEAAARVAEAWRRREAAERELTLAADEALRTAINTFVAVKITERAERRTGKEGVPLPNGRISEAEESFFTAFSELLANRTGSELESRVLGQEKSSPAILLLSIEQAIQFQQGLSDCLPDEPKTEVYERLSALQSAEVVRLYRELLMKRITNSFEGVTDPEVQRVITELAAQSVVTAEALTPLPVGSPFVELTLRALGNRPLAPVARPAASPAMVTPVADEGEIVRKLIDQLALRLTEFGTTVGNHAGTAAAAAVPTAWDIADATYRRQPKVKHPGFLSRLPGRLALLGTGAALGATAGALIDGVPSDWFSRDEVVDAPAGASKGKDAKDAKVEVKAGGGAEQVTPAPTFTAWVKLSNDVTAETWAGSFGSTGDLSKIAICCRAGAPVKGEGICLRKTIYSVPPEVEASWGGRMWDTSGEDVRGYQAFPKGEDVKSVCKKAQEGMFGTVLVRD